MAREKFYPTQENLGKDCMFWRGVDITQKKNVGRIVIGCIYPKAEIEGRLSCEGIIDDVCLYIIHKETQPKGFSQEQLDDMYLMENRNLPPGNIP